MEWKKYLVAGTGLLGFVLLFIINKKIKYLVVGTGLLGFVLLIIINKITKKNYYWVLVITVCFIIYYQQND